MSTDQKRRRENAGDRKRRNLREQLWPGSSRQIWDFTDHDGVVGFATIPRLMPLVMHLIKILAGGSGSGDPSPVYLELWCRDFGQGIVTISDEAECAYAAGFSYFRSAGTACISMSMSFSLPTPLACAV